MTLLPLIAALTLTQTPTMRPEGFGLRTVDVAPRVSFLCSGLDGDRVVPSIVAQGHLRLAKTPKADLGFVIGSFINAPLNEVARKLFPAMEGSTILTIAGRYAVADLADLPPARPVTLELHEADIIEAVRAWAGEAGIEVNVDPNLKGKLSLKTESAPAFKTLVQMLQPFEATYTIDRGICFVSARTGILPDLDNVVPKFENNESQFSALEQLGRENLLALELEPSITLAGKVNISMVNAKLGVILEAILGKEYSIEPKGWRYYVRRKL